MPLEQGPVNENGLNETGTRVEERPELNTRVQNLQLEYVDRLRKGSTPMPDGTDPKELKLGELLLSFTDIRRELSNAYGRRTGKPADPSDEEYGAFFDSVFAAIRDAYISNPDGWMSEVENSIREKVNQLPKHTESVESTEDERLKVGIFTYHPYALRDFSKYYGDDGFFKKELGQHGISDAHQCVSVHLDPLAEQMRSGKTSAFVSSSLSKLAETIVEEHPETSAILGRSWLLDTPLAQKIGFTVSPPLPTRGGMGLWYQFLDKDGNIKQEEVDRLFKTGKPRFAEREGYMLIEDFLRRYLPPEKKGEVHLKRPKPGVFETEQRDRVFMSQLVEAWDALSEDMIRTMIGQTTFPKKFFFDTEKGSRMLEQFLLEKKNGRTYQQILEGATEDERRAYEIFLQGERYEDRVVTI